MSLFSKIVTPVVALLIVLSMQVPAAQSSNARTQSKAVVVTKHLIWKPPIKKVKPRKHVRRVKPSRFRGLSNKEIGRVLVKDRRWSHRQYACLVILWDRESHWRIRSSNSAGAYGIPQALPGHKMATRGKDWRTNPITQIQWGLDYIKGRYGSPCNALGHSNRYGWY